MLHSMTGFGRCTVETNGKKITVEAKSLNSKQLDLTVRVPQAFRMLEADIRNEVSSVLERGKIDVMVTSESITDRGTIRFNLEAMSAYKSQLEEMSKLLGIPEPQDWYSVLMRLPDALHSDSVSEVSEEELAVAFEASKEAIRELMEYRRTEGIKLEDFFSKRIEKISQFLKEINPLETERIQNIKAKLKDNLEKLAPIEFDSSRFEQEMIYYLEKLDINEEKQRLAQHLSYFMETVNSDTKGKGKKLGFIAQEMGREINTLGSKSNNAAMQKIVVMMKDELEQIKEQVLNVM